MRQGFDHQTTLGCTPIDQVEIPTKMKGHMAALMAAIQYIYADREWSGRVARLLSAKLIKGKKQTGRKGMGLWEIFVLGQVRLCMNISYDELHFMANDSEMLRGILGVLPTDYSKGKQYEYQTIYDNVGLLDDELLKEVNQVIVEVGHQVFKKKENTPLRLKTDSYVVETNTHFPTDYNLLYDSGRKCIDLAIYLRKKDNLEGWRKAADWKKQLKGLMRQVGKTSSSGGKNKAERLQVAVNGYLSKARQLEQKVKGTLAGHQPKTSVSLIKMLEIEYYLHMLSKHIDLVERRLVKGETIPHEEKLFSVFMPFTEWINKGKLHPNVEIGKKLFITTDQHNLIVDYQIGNHQADNELTLQIADRLLEKHQIASLSTDKGFSDMQNKALLELYIPQVVMPKKGKRNQKEKELESAPAFKKLKNQHSAIESNINELEHRGLDRCPDKTQRNFNRYIGLGISAYNLHKIGRQLLADRLNKEKKASQQTLQKAA